MRISRVAKTMDGIGEALRSTEDNLKFLIGLLNWVVVIQDNLDRIGMDIGLTSQEQNLTSAGNLDLLMFSPSIPEYPEEHHLFTTIMTKELQTTLKVTTVLQRYRKDLTKKS